MKARALSLAALASACTVLPPVAPPSPPPPAILDRGASAIALATIAVGGQAYLNGISIEPRGVVEDSRCPADVRCVWAGRLILEVLVGLPGQAPVLRQLTLGQPVAMPTGGMLTLAAAFPPRLAAGGPPATHFTFEWRPR